MQLKSLYFILILTVFGISVSAQDSSKLSDSKKGKKAVVQYGVASYYSNNFQGKKTSSGELFNQKKLTAAHNTLPLGTYIRVTNLKNGKSVVVKVNDRLHHRNKRLVDLSYAAAQKLGYVKSGLTRVKVEVLGKKPQLK